MLQLHLKAIYNDFCKKIEVTAKKLLIYIQQALHTIQ